MRDGLKPCPHCGEEHICLFDVQDDDGPAFAVGCVTEGCPGHVAASWHYVTKEKAVEAWNTRTERTCHMDMVKDGPLCSVWKFDCCGFEFAENKCDDWNTELPGTWCPNCGAKVVS